MTCVQCQTTNPKMHKAAPTLHPIAVVPQIWSQVGMDLGWTLSFIYSVGHQLYLYIFILYNLFILSMYTSSTQVMCRMGCPEVIITDQGREFVNSLSNNLYSTTRTEHRITSAYHPQTNGLTERFNQTLSRSLAKAANENQDNCMGHPHRHNIA